MAHTQAASGAVDVILADPSYAGFFGVGLSTPSASGYFGGAFGAATPAFTVDSVTATTFLDFLEYVTAFPLAITLNGGGMLVINDSGSTGVSASLTNAVPEPSSLICAAQAVLLLGLLASPLGHRNERS